MRGKVIAFGNPLRGDEGIGPYLLTALQEKWEGNDCETRCQWEFIDLGTSGMRLLTEMEHIEKLIVVDCALMGQTAGSIRSFSLKDIDTIKVTDQFSFHDTDLIRIIELAQRLHQCPEEIVIFGVEPETLAYQQELSPVLSTRTPDYLQLIEDEMKIGRQTLE